MQCFSASHQSVSTKDRKHYVLGCGRCFGKKQRLRVQDADDACRWPSTCTSGSGRPLMLSCVTSTSSSVPPILGRLKREYAYFARTSNTADSKRLEKPCSDLTVKKIRESYRHTAKTAPTRRRALSNTTNKIASMIQ
jgi:hypothetical protein